MNEQLEILNISIVEEARELMSDRFPMMVKYFLEDTQMYLEEIEKGVKENNAEIAISPAHTLNLLQSNLVLKESLIYRDR